MKNTAVEWLVEKLKSQGLLIGEIENLVAVKEAKAMEKEQIIDAYAQGFIESENMDKGAEQYYNETFKSE
jgi:hypothetical protein